MVTRVFFRMLEALWSQGRFVCVGLDLEYDKIPAAASGPSVVARMVNFARAIVDATKDLVCAYKMNAAFYAAKGDEGLHALRQIIAYIHKVAPQVPVIFDGKRTDIGNTNAAYAEEVFGHYGADATTVNPYFGGEALQPFLDQKEKGIIVLCRTSNPGAGEFQDLSVNNIPLYQIVAYHVACQWNENGNCGLVVGATCPDELRKVREIVGDMTILLPGVGFQQKGVPLETQVEQVVSAGKDSRGQGIIVHSARGIIFASNGPDFAEAARRETEKLHELIQSCREKGSE